MQPSSSLPGTFEADDVNSMQLHPPPPRSPGHAGLQGWWLPGGIPVWERGLFGSKNFWVEHLDSRCCQQSQLEQRTDSLNPNFRAT
jgi:hypothetical protein